MSVEEVSNIEDVVDSKLIKIFEQAKFELETAISKLSFSGILFYIPLINMKYIPNMSIKTIGVGVINNFDLVLYYNPVFFINQTNIQKIAILKHESLHILLQHLSRVADSSSNRRLYNIAADIAINQEIKDREAIDNFVNNSKQQAHQGIEGKAGLKELSISESQATAEVSKLNSIHSDDLEHQGRLERSKEENAYYKSLEIDHDSPLIASQKKDIELISNASEKLMISLVKGLKEFDIDCQQVKGNQHLEPEYYLDINKEDYKLSLEHFLESYKILEKL